MVKYHNIDTKTCVERHGRISEARKIFGGVNRLQFANYYKIQLIWTKIQYSNLRLLKCSKHIFGRRFGTFQPYKVVSERVARFQPYF